MCAEGLFKAQSDDDPFNTLKETFTRMVDRKQQMKTPEPMMIEEKDMQEEDVRTKNIIHQVEMTNRAPNLPSPDDIGVEDTR